MDEIRAGAVTIPAAEIELRFTRSGGPGGQNVNKRDTRVEAIFDLAASPSLTGAQKQLAAERLRGRLDARGRLRVVSDAARTQAGNRTIALRRLAEAMAEALRPPPPERRATQPTRAARERRIFSKKARGRIKEQRRTPGAEPD